MEIPLTFGSTTYEGACANMKTGAPIGAPRFISVLILAAAATTGVAAIIVIVVAAAAAAAVAEDQQQDDDPPPVVTTEATADTVIVIAHKYTSKNFVELCCPHSMLFHCAKKVQRLVRALHPNLHIL